MAHLIVALTAHDGYAIHLSEFQKLFDTGLIGGTLCHTLIVGVFLTGVVESTIGWAPAEGVPHKEVAHASRLQVASQVLTIELWHPPAVRLAAHIHYHSYLVSPQQVEERFDAVIAVADGVTLHFSRLFTLTFAHVHLRNAPSLRLAVLYQQILQSPREYTRLDLTQVTGTCEVTGTSPRHFTGWTFGITRLFGIMGDHTAPQGQAMETLERIFDRTVAEVIVREELEEKLSSGRPLRLKLGLDPSKPNLHIGHAIGLRKMRQFQELGHQVVLIVGDWTAQIGDPSGRDESRAMLSPEEVQRNAETYMQQFFIVVDRARTEIRWQSEWFGNFTLADVFNLTSRFTMGQMMAHETFRKRWEEGKPLTLMELMYPTLQAYDSVAIEADVEFGGMDQKFNILAGRDLQSSLGLPPQDVFLVPLLPGTDGRKMSKSFENTIDLTDPPEQMYGKAMSISDGMLDEYLALVSTIPDAELQEIRHALAGATVNPRDIKMRLARDTVCQFHGEKAAGEAEAEFVRVFQKRRLPSEMPVYHPPSSTMLITDLLQDAGLTSSASAARRVISQGGVRIDGEKVEDFGPIDLTDGMIIRVGKRKFLKIVRGKE